MKTLNEMRNLAKEIESKRQQHQKIKENEKLREYRSLQDEAAKNKNRILRSINSSGHLKFEKFIGGLRYDYAVTFFCISAISVSMWMCRDLILNGNELFRKPVTKVLPFDSRESADVNDQLHKMLDGAKLSDLLNSDKLSLGNVTGLRKDEICGNLNLLSGQEFTVNTIVARHDPESYAAYCSFDKAGGYIIELAKSDRGFSIIKIDSDN